MLTREAGPLVDEFAGAEAFFAQSYGEAQLLHAVSEAAKRARADVTRLADQHLNRMHRQVPDVKWTVNVTWLREKFVEYFNGAVFHDPSEFK